MRARSGDRSILHPQRTNCAHFMNATIANPEPELPEEDLLTADFFGQLSPQAVVRRNEPLAKKTTLRVGGPADFYAEPASECDLALLLRFCAERTLPFFVLG